MLPLPPILTARLRHAFATVTACAAALLLPSIGNGQLALKDPPSAIKGLEIVEHLSATVPLDLEFTDSSGTRLPLKSMFGQAAKRGGKKPVVVALVYYRCPMQCKTILYKLTNRFDQLDLTIGDDFNVAVVSFDPSESRDAAARTKAEQFTLYTRERPPTLDESWRFMTSDGANARTLADSLGFPYRYLPDSNEYSHGTVIFVLTPEGKISRYLYGIDYPPEQLKLALLEASDGKIGTTIDRVFMWCFHYDPDAGAYTVQAVRVMQLGGALTLGGLGGLMMILWSIDRRRRRKSTMPSDGPSAPPPIADVSATTAALGVKTV